MICLVDQERSIKTLADLMRTHRQHSRHEEVCGPGQRDPSVAYVTATPGGRSSLTYSMKVDGKTPYERLRHNAECRTRFERLPRRREAAAAGRPTQNDAGSSAQAPQAAETDADAQVDSAAGDSAYAAAAGSTAQPAKGARQRTLNGIEPQGNAESSGGVDGGKIESASI